MSARVQHGIVSSAMKLNKVTCAAMSFTADYTIPQHCSIECKSIEFLQLGLWLLAMTAAAPCRVPEIESVFFNLPNLHFLPLNPVTSKVSGFLKQHLIAGLCNAFIHSAKYVQIGLL